MDGVKLTKWRENFKAGIGNLQIEFDAFFVEKKLDEFYSLKVDEVSQNLVLEILNQDELPKEIADRLIQIFTQAKPEDSI